MLGGHSALDPLLPIPNRTVKRSCADDSAHTVCESRSPPGSPTKTPLRSQPRGVFFIRNRLVSLWYNCVRRVSPHCRVVNLVRSGRKQPQPFTASAGGKARRFHFQATALRIVSRQAVSISSRPDLSPRSEYHIYHSDNWLRVFGLSQGAQRLRTNPDQAACRGLRDFIFV